MWDTINTLPEKRILQEIYFTSLLMALFYYTKGKFELKLSWGQMHVVLLLTL